MKDKIIKIFIDALNYDGDGSAWISESNYNESIVEFKINLDKIIETENK